MASPAPATPQPSPNTSATNSPRCSTLLNMPAASGVLQGAAETAEQGWRARARSCMALPLPCGHLRCASTTAVSMLLARSLAPGCSLRTLPPASRPGPELTGIPLPLPLGHPSSRPLGILPPPSQPARPKWCRVTHHGCFPSPAHPTPPPTHTTRTKPLNRTQSHGSPGVLEAAEGAGEDVVPQDGGGGQAAGTHVGHRRAHHLGGGAHGGEYPRALGGEQ